MPSFDISTLIEFNPPTERCPLCHALWPSGLASQTSSFTCPGCGSLLVSHSQTITTTVGGTGLSTDLPALGPVASGQNLSLLGFPTIQSTVTAGHAIDLGPDPLSHAVELARLARQMRAVDDDNPPLRVLMNLLQKARAFVHITSFGFDEFTIAVLEMAAQKVPIAVVFSGADKNKLSGLLHVSTEAPYLECRVEGTRHDHTDQNHGKLIVVDGLLALTGSTNLTRPAWRKAAANMEIVDVVTDLSRITELNNRYFSPLWARLQPDPQERYNLFWWTLLTPADPEHPAHRRTSGPDAPYA
jgi:phosphatidylserine/phosphatidylglycerophosphate/cardiolipin synthase-like enzyme